MHRKVQLLTDFLLVIFIILFFFSISMKLLLQSVIFMEEGIQSRIQLELNRIGASLVFSFIVSGLLSFTSHGIFKEDLIL